MLLVVLGLFGGVLSVHADSFRPTPEQWMRDFCHAGQECQVGDVNGDGKADVLAFVRSSSNGDHTGNVLVALSQGTSFRLTNAP